MDPERWRKIEKLYESVVERSPAERAALLAEADPDIRAEVKALLAQPSGGALLDQPAGDLLDESSLTQLPAGTRLGHYQIQAMLGRGGMGVVYRAKDTTLGREVAIKVLPDALAEDPDRLARFNREAKVLASLNHPNIGHIYGVESQALVMELVEGETLISFIKPGPLPIETALSYARQIAEALEAAHEKGIIHRDLKPANIMITPAGLVKVLDFGLAKADESSAAGDTAESPATTQSPTLTGVILGTAAYMSPEQARGFTVDKRTDIWAFGVVLYEMLTGRRAFAGQSVTDILAGILRGVPDWSALPAATPMRIRKLLRRCLEPDRKQRLQAIGEARIAIDAPEQAEAPLSVRARLWPWALTAVVTIVAGVLAYEYFHRGPEETRVLKFSVVPPEGAILLPGPVMAVSPDGRHLAFVAKADGKALLWVRDLNSLAVRPLPGTEGAGIEGVTQNPFWSPDSRFIAFTAGGKLKKIAATGGPVVTLCDGIGTVGGTWSKNGVILFAPNADSVLFRIPAAGGSAAPVTALDKALSEHSHRWPRFLPDGRHFLYTAYSLDQKKSTVYAGDLDSKDDFKTRHRVLSANSNVVYAPPGLLLLVREGDLIAQPFDVNKAQITGDPVSVAEQVLSFSDFSEGQFSASQNGVLAYRNGGKDEAGFQLAWFDRQGKILGTLGEPGFLTGPAISPDGRTVAVDRLDLQKNIFDIWLYDLARGSTSRFTFNSKNNGGFPEGSLLPVWSPDGAHIAFGSTRDGGFNLYQKATNGSPEDEALDKTARRKTPGDWSRDGRYIIEYVGDHAIWVLPLFGDRKPFPYLETEFHEPRAKLSPNGQFLAYMSDETKRFEIYVQTFPNRGGKWMVSSNGGGMPAWSRDGKELFFIGTDRRMMVVEVKSNAGSAAKFEASVPKPLFMTNLEIASPYMGFDVSQDGRFLIPTAPTSTAPITVEVNWIAGLKK